MSWLLRFKMEQRDRLIHNRAVRSLIARGLLLRMAVRKRPDTPQESADTIVQLCRIARLTQSNAQLRQIEEEIQRQTEQIGTEPVDWSCLTGAWKKNRIEKAVVLKPYISPRERGVVLVSFEYQWARLMALQNLREFAERYQLVTAPTWSPPHSIENSLFAAQYPDRRIVTLISNAQDLHIFPRLSPKYRVAPLYASNWVNPDLYAPVEWGEKDIDIVMVAGFGTYKRHFALFRALREMPRTVRVVLVGQAVASRTSAILMQEAAQYGEQDRIELRESVPDATVVDTLARAKISVILSMQEGSCVAVVESMIANTPVGVFEDAIVGSKAFVNEHTGRLLRHENLGGQLMDFLSKARHYTPRKWTLEHGVDCYGSTATLNQVMRETALESGEEWTQDIAVHHWRPDPVLVGAEDQERMAASYVELRERFQMVLGKSL